MKIKYYSPSSSPIGLLQKTGAIVVGGVVAGVVLMFSTVVLVGLLSVGLLGWAYLWWKTRTLRKQLKAQMQSFATMTEERSSHETYEGEIIEGTVINVEQDGDKR